MNELAKPVESQKQNTSDSSDSFFRRLSHKFWELLRHKDPPGTIALGAGLGVFIGFLPIMGIQMAVVTLVALPFKANLKAANVAVWLSNPVTFIPLYWLNYKVGLLFCPHRRVGWNEFGGEMAKASEWQWSHAWDSMMNLVNMGADIFLPLWIGSALLGVVFGVIAYFAMYRWVVFYRRKIKHQ